MFTPEDVWHGGYYELAIELGDRSDSRLALALRTVWQHPTLEGCYLRSDIEPEAQERVLPIVRDDGWGSHWRGVATLPNGHRVACGTCVVRENDGPDWLDLYLPMGGLESAYDVGAYPFDDEAETPPTWIDDLESWLANIAMGLAPMVDYRLALIGFEVSGDTYADTIEREGIPGSRTIGYVYPCDGTYSYFARNVGDTVR